MLVACILGSVIVFLDSSVVNVALPAIQRDLGGGLALQQWVVDAYLLTLGSLILVGGSLGALFGVVARVLRFHGARALAGGVAYGLSVLGVMSLLVLPRVGAASGAGKPITDMGAELGWPTFVAYFLIFGLVLGAWVWLRPQDIGAAPRAGSRATMRRRLTSASRPG